MLGCIKGKILYYQDLMVSVIKITLFVLGTDHLKFLFKENFVGFA